MMLVKPFILYLITPRKSISTGCYFAKKLILWLWDQNTLIEQSHISIMINGNCLLQILDGKLQFDLEWPNEYLNSMSMGEYHTNWIVKSIYFSTTTVSIFVCVLRAETINSNISKYVVLKSMAEFQINFHQKTFNRRLAWNVQKNIYVLVCVWGCVSVYCSVHVVCVSVGPLWFCCFLEQKKICSQCSSLPSCLNGDLIAWCHLGKQPNQLQHQWVNWCKLGKLSLSHLGSFCNIDYRFRDLFPWHLNNPAGY